MSEQDLTRAILSALTAKRVWCWRMNSGMTTAEYKGKSRKIQMAPTGTPDILGALEGGQMFGLEVKTRTGKQSPGQALWQARAENSGVRYRVVRSISEALAAINEWSQ